MGSSLRLNINGGWRSCAPHDLVRMTKPRHVPGVPRRSSVLHRYVDIADTSFPIDGEAIVLRPDNSCDFEARRTRILSAEQFWTGDYDEKRMVGLAAVSRS